MIIYYVYLYCLAKNHHSTASQTLENIRLIWISQQDEGSWDPLPDILISWVLGWPKGICLFKSPLGNFEVQLPLCIYRGFVLGIPDTKICRCPVPYIKWHTAMYTVGPLHLRITDSGSNTLFSVGDWLTPWVWNSRIWRAMLYESPVHLGIALLSSH